MKDVFNYHESEVPAIEGRCNSCGHYQNRMCLLRSETVSPIYGLCDYYVNFADAPDELALDKLTLDEPSIMDTLIDDDAFDDLGTISDASVNEWGDDVLS